MEPQNRWNRLTLLTEHPLNISGGSNKRIEFRCDCGRIVETPFYKVTSGHSKSCGKCELRTKEYWLKQKWGSLRLSENSPLPPEWKLNYPKKLTFICDCTRTSEKVFYSVSRGHVTTCGKCLYRSKEYWLKQKWGKLKLDPNQKLPDEWSETSVIKLRCLCDCNNASYPVFHKLTSGVTRSCGGCTVQSKEFWLKQKWGDLTIIDSIKLPIQWARGAKLVVDLVCNCGRSTSLPFYSLKHVKTCGDCSKLPKSYWLAKTWGKLKLDPDQDLPDELSLGSGEKFSWICTCGRKCTPVVLGVTSGNTKSCGHCSQQTKEYWLQQKWGRLQLNPKQVLLDEFPPSATPLSFICNCGTTSSIVFNNVVSGNTKSCGCMRIGENEFSPETEIRSYVQSLSYDTYPTSYPIEGTRKSYDVYVPSKHLAIEYHGLVWHSEKFNKEGKDHEKFLLARARGDKLIQIYSDEWRDKEGIMKEMLASLITHPKGKRIKPIFTLHTKTPLEARSFLDQHHYLGAASGCLTVLAKDKDQIVGVWVFMKREEGVILWHRACVDHKFKMWNPHSTALSLALPVLKEMGFKKMVTFSDNRFHTGELYTKLGFIFEKELNPDYGYTDGTNRVSKYNLRVKAGINEKASAQAKGWFRIWDSGKKRFSLSI
jgi:hypothetical protein